ncbi:MAG: Rrf2 family transcriptional regulator [Cyanobacteria bacterium]|nr:Rrf2 family transcriptional regulator [Cyanobacteriota bacterium]
MGIDQCEPMGFSAKTQYGLVALLDLAGAYDSGALVQTGEICKRHSIPERYLEQMLTGLRKAGLLTSIRGPKGGFQLSLNPDKITVAAVVAALEGSSTKPQRELNDPAFEVLAALEQRLESTKESLLNATTLAQLLREHDAIKQPLPMFFI